MEEKVIPLTTNIKDIPGYDGLYAITEDGKVWSYAGKKRGNIHGRDVILKGRFLKLEKTKKGYLRVKFIDKKRYLVHKLVAITYLNKIEGKDFINHINGVKDDNRIENLEWCTQSENVKHSFITLGRKHTTKMLEHTKNMSIKNQKKVMQLTKEGILCKIYDSCKQANILTGLNASKISWCALGKQPHCGGYLWKYL